MKNNNKYQNDITVIQHIRKDLKKICENFETTQGLLKKLQASVVEELSHEIVTKDTLLSVTGFLGALKQADHRSITEHKSGNRLKFIIKRLNDCGYKSEEWVQNLAATDINDHSKGEFAYLPSNLGNNNNVSNPPIYQGFEYINMAAKADLSSSLVPFAHLKNLGNNNNVSAMPAPTQVLKQENKVLSDGWAVLPNDQQINNLLTVLGTYKTNQDEINTAKDQLVFALTCKTDWYVKLQNFLVVIQEADSVNHGKRLQYFTKQLKEVSKTDYSQKFQQMIDEKKIADEKAKICALEKQSPAFQQWMKEIVDKNKKKEAEEPTHDYIYANAFSDEEDSSIAEKKKIKEAAEPIFIYANAFSDEEDSSIMGYIDSDEDSIGGP